MKDFDRSILLLNNDPNILSIFSVLLGEFGYNLRVALDYETSINIIENKKIDIIIIDIDYIEIEPIKILNFIKENKKDIPIIALLRKELFNETYTKEIYPVVFDIVVKPITNIDDFRKRIIRAIDNSKLKQDNKIYKEILLEKSFRAGMFDILSKILIKVDNFIDQLLADLLLWKENYLLESKDSIEQKEKFEKYFNSLKEKIINLEEIIQINEVLLSENPFSTEFNINTIIEDITRILKDTLDSNSIKIILNCSEIKKVKYDSSKIVQCLLHFIENSIFSLKNAQIPDKEIKISTKLINNNIEVIIEDNSYILSEQEQNINNLNNIELNTKSNFFSLADIKNYIDSIGGKINIYCDEKDKTKKVVFEIPVN